MKKSRNVIFNIFAIAMLVMTMCVTVTPTIYAANGDNVVDSVIDKANQGQGVTVIDSAVTKVWGAVLSILQILAVAAIIIAGVRYMFSAADQKAEIKKSMLILVIGAILVFAASTVVQFIINATNQVI